MRVGGRVLGGAEEEETTGDYGVDGTVDLAAFWGSNRGCHSISTFALD